MSFHTPPHKVRTHSSTKEVGVDTLVPNALVAAEAEAFLAKHAPKPFDELAFIIAWEEGELEDYEIVDGFQHLIDSGTVWHLQGTYQRTAVSLIDQGHCTAPR